MTLPEILAHSAIFIGSTFKFTVIATTVVAANMGVSGMLANLLGGVVGIIICAYINEVIQNWFIKRNPEKYGRRFTKRTRLLAKLKQRFGLWGIAFLTPLILSIPIGVFFALDLTSNKRKVILQMTAACFFWASLIYTPYFLFNIDVVKWVKNLFS
ncbi:MAG TPA: hypothetical protein VGB95_06530 [Chitinophagales bacterium]